MSKQNCVTMVAMALWVLFLTSLIYFSNFGQISPIEGSKLITSGELCSDHNCVQRAKITLPYFVPMRYATANTKLYMQFQFEMEMPPEQIQAVYLPKISDNIAITLNGTEIRRPRLGGRMWNHPILSQISNNLLRVGQNRIDIVLTGPPQQGVSIFPFYVGSLSTLEPVKNFRTSIGIGVTRFSLGLMAILFVVIGGVWVARRDDPIFLWLSLSCFSACIFLAHYGYDISYFPYKYWTLSWAVSIYLYVFFIMKFINRFLELPKLPLEKFYLWFIVVSAAIMVVAPAKYVFLLTLVLNIGTAICALGVLIVFWQNREKSALRDFAIFFLVLSVSLAIGLYEEILNLLNEPPRSLHILQYMPIAMSIVCLWLIMSRLIRSLSEFETLTGSLHEIIEQKTKELAKSYRDLAEAEKHKAVDEERQRIMLDLHDGIGGQLVNTLAYMENRNVGDETLRSALEDALRDLALMLDSLENQDSITTLLGMLRTRLEALLEANGLEFDWQIGEEPILPVSGPSQNLHLARIVQEAITNIIKHANASVITVASNASSVTISDNGSGFDPTNLPEQGNHGIIGMHRRAKQIGAQIKVTSSASGTQVKLILPD
ncbi:MAG: hypothetical protein JKX93_10860 [Rhizobiaceae bacterium]|nr:hypothetical protein [Rhizobiaceae bacterium]